MAKGLWGWILTITALKMVVLTGTAVFARTIAGFLGNINSPSITGGQAKAAILAAFVAALLMFGAELLIGEAEYRCTAKARQSLRAQIFSKVLELDVGNIEKIGPVSAITSSVDGVESMQIYYSKYLPGLLYCLIAPFYLFFQMRKASLPVAVLLFAVSFLLMPANNIFRKHIEKLKTEYWNTMENLTGYYLESVQGLTTLKLFGQDQLRTDRLQEKTERFNKKIMDVMKVNFASMLLTDGMIYTSVVLSVAIVCSQLLSSKITLSAALTVLLLSFGFFGSVRQLMNTTHSALAGVSAADKVSRLLDIDTTRPYDPSILIEEKPYSGIQMEKVTFSYEGRVTTIDNLSLVIPKGKTTALVGLSGCGKSTVAGLLMRFFDPSSGKITIDGQNYIAFTPEELRKRIIMVPQTVSLFSGTVRENLQMAAPNATDEEMLDVLEEVRLKDWILKQPDGLSTDVGDGGGKLSGGQRQKIGIARALLCRVEYIVFDEATSSVDMESEQEIWNCIDELANTRTLIIISHRLSTIREADNIYVLEQGRIVQSGTHSQMMEQVGLYRRLVEEQTLLEHQGEEELIHE